jgi:hypothetical protein
MFNAIRSAKGTSQLVWLAGGKGFVYTESQPTGVHSSLAVRVPFLPLPYTHCERPLNDHTLVGV